MCISFLSWRVIETLGTEYAKQTATQKAVEVARRLQSEDQLAGLVIGADTVVEAPDGTILEKPKDAEEALKMLRALSGAAHKVHTGVAIVLPGVAGLCSFCSRFLFFCFFLSRRCFNEPLMDLVKN